MTSHTTSVSTTPRLITQDQLTAYNKCGWQTVKTNRSKDEYGNISEVITLKQNTTKCDVATAQCKSVRNTVCYSLAAIPFFALSLAGSIMTATFECFSSMPNLEPLAYEDPPTNHILRTNEPNQQRQTTEETDCYACLILGLNKIFYDTMQPCTCLEPEEHVMRVRVAKDTQRSLHTGQPSSRSNEQTRLLPKDGITYSL